MKKHKISMLAGALVLTVANMPVVEAQTIRTYGPGGALWNEHCPKSITITPDVIDVRIDYKGACTGSSSSSSSTSSSSSSTSTSSSSSSSSIGGNSGCGPNIPAENCFDGIYGTIYVKSRYLSQPSLTDNEVYAVRYPYIGGAGSYYVQQSETAIPGEYVVKYDGALSRIPGSFTETIDASGKRIPLPNACKKFNIGRPAVNAKDASLVPDWNRTTNCALVPGSVYYWNMRVNTTDGPAPGCGTSRAKWCSAQVIGKIQNW